MTAAMEKCTVCGAIIQQVANKYRLAKVPLKAEDVKEHTKIGQTLLNVTKSPDVLQLIKEDKLISNCCCRNCYRFIVKVDNAQQHIFLLRSELESKIKTTCVRSMYRQPPHTAQSVLQPVQVLPTVERYTVPVGRQQKRMPQSPLSKTGVTPPSKRPATSIRMLQPLAPGLSSPKAGDTPPPKRPPPPMRYLLPSLRPKQATLPSHMASMPPRELFPGVSQVSKPSTAQEEITISVFTDLESDPDEDIKVSAVNNPHASRILPSTIKEIGSALLYRKDMVEAVFKCADFRDKLIDKVMAQLTEECKHLCSKHLNSILRKCSPQQLLEFSMEDLMTEWQREAPLLHRFLVTPASSTSAPTTTQVPPICLAGSILLRTRNIHMSALQHIVGLLLFHGNATKQTVTRLNKLQVCMSAEATLQKVDDCAQGHDTKVKKWIEAQVQYLDYIEKSTIHSEKATLEPPATSPLCLEDTAPQEEACAVSVPLPRPPGVQLIGDNVDLRQLPSHQTLDRRSKDHHWFHTVAVQDRAVGGDIVTTQPLAMVKDLELHTFLPSIDDCIKLNEEFIILIARVLTNRLPAWKSLQECVPAHIPHKFSKEMATKSEIVPCGVIIKSEQETEGMIDIMADIQGYVPIASSGTVHPILFGGDQLTRERAYNAKDAKLQSANPLKKLQGIIPKIEDWHARFTFYQVIFNQLYCKESDGEKGTLKQLQTAINRTNIPTKVKDDPMAVEDFMDLTLDAHVVAAAMVFFGMTSVTSTPTTNVDIDAIKRLSKEEMWKTLFTVIQRFLDQYSPHGRADQVVTNVQALATEPAKRKKKKADVEKAEKDTKKKQSQSEDGIYNYACRILGMNLMARNFHDASREGDGERLIRCWKFLLLHFKSDGRIKYSVEAFHLLAQVNALLPPHLAHDLTWNRTCNVNGGEGKNIPLDLMVEHFNRVFKDDINTFRPNIGENSIARSSRAIGVMKEMLDKFDTLIKINKPSGRHVGPSDERDFSVMLKILVSEGVFKKQQGRGHRSFVNISIDPFASLKANPKPLFMWLKHRLQAESKEQDLLMNIL